MCKGIVYNYWLLLQVFELFYCFVIVLKIA